MSVDEMSVDEMSVDKMSVDEMLVDKIAVDEMSVDKMPVNKMPVDEMSGRQIDTAATFPQVLSSGSWPFQQSCVFTLPAELERCVTRFGTFYGAQHSGRKLNWLFHMSKGELVTNCFKNRLILFPFSSNHFSKCFINFAKLMNSNYRYVNNSIAMFKMFKILNLGGNRTHIIIF
jgi:hypothetical protein